MQSVADQGCGTSPPPPPNGPDNGSDLEVETPSSPPPSYLPKWTKAPKTSKKPQRTACAAISPNLTRSSTNLPM